MDLPYVKNGILFLEEEKIPIVDCTYQQLVAILNEPEEAILIDNTNWATFCFPNDYGTLKAHFILHDHNLEPGKNGEQLLEFTKATLAEIYFELYSPVALPALSEKHGQPRFLQSNGITFAAFNENFLAKMKNGKEVDCLWFLNFEAMKKSTLPDFYKELQLLFVSQLIH
ncbi:MAG: hypothetical protein WC460_04260 [Patescibacteria group bacterium]